MARPIWFFVLIVFALGCSSLPGTIANRSMTESGLKKLSLADREIPIEPETVVDVENRAKSGNDPAAKSPWSPDELMIGSAIKADLDQKTAEMSKRWEPTFDPNTSSTGVPVSTATDATDATDPASRISFDTAANETKSTEVPQPECRDAIMVAPHPLTPMPVPVDVGAPNATSAYTAPAEKTTDAPTRIPDCDEHALVGPMADETTTDPLDLLLAQLQSANQLHLNRVCLCRQVDGFGQIVEFSDAHFAPGERVLIYCEVENFHSRAEQDSASTKFRTRLSGSYLILDDEGTIVADRQYPAVDDVSQAAREDFYLVFPAQIPPLGPGNYRMYLVAEDELGNAIVAHGKPIRFHVELVGQAQR